MMGLVSGLIWFSSQLGRLFCHSFSYCLMDCTLSHLPTSYLTIGDVVSLKKDNHSRISYTPLLTDPVALNFYYIAIKGVFNGVKLTIDPPVWLIDELCNGGTVTDSVTTFNFFNWDSLA